jgi:5'-nucleotidase
MIDASPPLILLTNDDGIESPGLAAAAAALSPLGELLIIAPLHQQTSRGRGRPSRGSIDARIVRRKVEHQGQSWEGYAVDVTPAVAVDHGILELAGRPISLAVSGINYGENVGTSVTVSGTVGAALEAADFGIPAIAISLELPEMDFYTLNLATDFSAAIHFLRYFAEHSLDRDWLEDVDVLKLEIPVAAEANTPWVVTRQDRLAYYRVNNSTREDYFEDPTELELVTRTGEFSQEGTDAHALARGWVSVTPLSLDLTSRVDLGELRRRIAPGGSGG